MLINVFNQIYDNTYAQVVSIIEVTLANDKTAAQINFAKGSDGAGLLPIYILDKTPGDVLTEIQIKSGNLVQISLTSTVKTELETASDDVKAFFNKHFSL